MPNWIKLIDNDLMYQPFELGKDLPGFALSQMRNNKVADITSIVGSVIF
jgi:hypothetical protein